MEPTGYYNSSLPSVGNLNQAGLATQGTRLMVQFSNIPAGVALYASVAQITGSEYSTTTKATLVTTDAQANGLFNPMPATTTASCISPANTQCGIAPLTVINGRAMAVWEVTESDPDVLESIVFGIATAYNAPLTDTVAPTIKLGPLGSGVAEVSASVPRFGPAATIGLTVCAEVCLNAPQAITFNYRVGGPLPSPIRIVPPRGTHRHS